MELNRLRELAGMQPLTEAKDTGDRAQVAMVQRIAQDYNEATNKVGTAQAVGKGSDVAIVVKKGRHAVHFDFDFNGDKVEVSTGSNGSKSFRKSDLSQTFIRHMASEMNDFAKNYGGDNSVAGFQSI